MFLNFIPVSPVFEAAYSRSEGGTFHLHPVQCFTICVSQLHIISAALEAVTCV